MFLISYSSASVGRYEFASRCCSARKFVPCLRKRLRSPVLREALLEANLMTGM